MKKISAVLVIIIFSSICFSQNKNSNIMLENSAVASIASDIIAKQDILKMKKMSVLYFSNLEGKETKEGKRLSKKLLSELLKKDVFIFIERSEISRVIDAQVIEQTGIVDTEYTDKSGKILPVDVIISGTIAMFDKHGELTVKAVDVTSGKIYLSSLVVFIPAEKVSYTENADKVRLHKSDPEKLEIMNKTFNAMQYLNKNRPGLFLFAIIGKQDRNKLRNERPEVLRRLKIIKRRVNQKARAKRKIKKLRRGLKILKSDDSQRYEILQDLKSKIIRGTDFKRSRRRR